MREKIAGWLAVITYQITMVPRIPRMAIAGHVATSISAAVTTIIPRIRQSMLDSKALNPVSGKSNSNKVRRVRLAWIIYSITRVKYMTPHKSQPITPTGIVGCSSRPAS